MLWLVIFFSLLNVNLHFAVAQRHFLTNIEEDNNHLTVRIDTGRIKGKILTTVDNKIPYYSFLSIPYAEPPIGELRFKPPVAKSKWTEVLATDKMVAVCPQVTVDRKKVNESCLYINVYTPDLTGSKSVMVYIHGGAFINGSYDQKVYGPDFLIDENVVVVTFNYRLGVFGFLTTQDDIIPENNGLRDQILALEWIQRNIDKFGGNPKDVTIFGESAGSASVSYLLQTPLTKGLFHKAILESGVSLCLWARCRKPIKVANQLAKTLGISANNSVEFLKKLKDFSTTKLLRKSLMMEGRLIFQENPANGLPFAPSLEPKGLNSVSGGYSHEQLIRGEFHKIPLMVGYNSEEALTFYDVAGMIPLGKELVKMYFSDPKTLVPIDMSARNDFIIDIGKIIRHYYCPKYSSLFDGFLLCSKGLLKFLSHNQFVRPINEYIRLISKYTKTYFYKFSYVGELGNHYGRRKFPGVGHEEEVHYIWNEGERATKLDQLIRKRLVRMWTNFAKTGNPTPEKDPLLHNVIWPKTDPQKRTYLDINVNMTVGEQPFEDSFKFWNNLYHQYGKGPYDTY